VRCTVDIIVPVHNIKERGANLAKILSEKCPDGLKLIVVSDSKLINDHVSVNRIVQESANPTTRVVHGDFQNPGKARNIGLRSAEAEWVAFLDSDDEIDFDKLLLLVKNADLKSAQLAIGGIYYVFEDDTKNCHSFLNPSISIFSNLSLTPAFTRIVFNKSILWDDPFPNFRMAEDQCFVLGCLSSKPIIYCEEIYFYGYSIGKSDQLTKDLASLQDLFQSISYICSILDGLSFDSRRVAYTMIIRQSITFYMTVGLHLKKNSLALVVLLSKITARNPWLLARSLFLVLFYRPRRNYVKQA
jgi:glycosyltransferase involved in cell wall biosynthesis